MQTTATLTLNSVTLTSNYSLEQTLELLGQLNKFLLVFDQILMVNIFVRGRFFLLFLFQDEN